MSGIYTILPVKRDFPGTKMFRQAFGDDPKTCEDASPTAFAKNAKPPILVITEADESGGGEGVPASMMVRASAKSFQSALNKAGFKDATFVDARDRNHITIVTNMMKSGDDPTLVSIVEFIRKRCKDLDK